MSTDNYSIEKRLLHAEADLKYSLARFGDYLAERENYKANKGMVAVHFYVCHKFNWPPAVVQAMKAEDLRFLLSEEMHGWTLPEEAEV